MQAPAVVNHVTHHTDSDRPNEPFTTENAKRKGLSNACSGRMRVTCPLHHFGPIGPEYDPERGLGVCVGDTWTSRLHCRQWGAHVPHVAGIAGQSAVGAQSIVLSGTFCMATPFPTPACPLCAPRKHGVHHGGQREATSAWSHVSMERCTVPTRLLGMLLFNQRVCTDKAHTGV